ncbi:tetratricopeptide repeat protein [Ochrovirga pacifica]|uniref:tetratricopeptide repeat protein n=1 Tax=Ochrovirga pacifica TaxID=1042376 RepID=UPI0002559830|nr:tetratricopeptide repeat protein [Ochrovirga pacifica]
MKNFVFGVLMLVVGFVSAQNSQELFQEGNQYYQEENYLKAIQSYKNIVKKDEVSSELYFNLANAYYKINKMAEAIYYYEKALQLNPTNKDAQLNLAYANRGIIDSIKSVPKSVFEKLNDNLQTLLSYNQWALASVILSLTAGCIWILFFFSIKPATKKMFFTLSIIFTIACCGSLAITMQQYHYTKNTVYAIVFAEEVIIRNAPRETASEVFILHQGTKLKVLDEVGTWQKIKISDGQIGWVDKKLIKKL